MCLFWHTYKHLYTVFNPPEFVKHFLDPKWSNYNNKLNNSTQTDLRFMQLQQQ